ncbi:hypothetical protein EVAR_11097_1 [Eumeta japonica]|uniref:MYND-type domain-containing protein n=1 Tax=Eumeta variegata TaxID=151549 RepID=A0A4C1U5E5_EUMVA|nr:hypothetical protein EVAR_11097_1 [Eumeta japonica]
MSYVVPEGPRAASPEAPVLPTLQQASPATHSFSPTLAKLLTSSERRQAAPLPSFGQAKSPLKKCPRIQPGALRLCMHLLQNCGEITITPVQPQPEPPHPHPQQPHDKPDRDDVVHLDDEESPASEGSGSGSGEGEAGRLVIDESAPGAAAGAGAADGEAPLCQGCRRRDAQFVCAGCANQWYCSRDCQSSPAVLVVDLILLASVRGSAHMDIELIYLSTYLYSNHGPDSNPDCVSVPLSVQFPITFCHKPVVSVLETGDDAGNDDGERVVEIMDES